MDCLHTKLSPARFTNEAKCEICRATLKTNSSGVYEVHEWGIRFAEQWAIVALMPSAGEIDYKIDIPPFKFHEGKDK